MLRTLRFGVINPGLLLGVAAAANNFVNFFPKGVASLGRTANSPMRLGEVEVASETVDGEAADGEVVVLVQAAGEEAEVLAEGAGLEAAVSSPGPQLAIHLAHRAASLTTVVA